MTYKISVIPLHEREAIISKRVNASKEHGEEIYDFRSNVLKPELIDLPIGFPVYRMENCRTFSSQQTEIAKNNREKDYFIKGQELSTAQQAQHKILMSLMKGTDSISSIDDVLNKDGQQETILITCSGIVVNGNRRLCAMRELYQQEDGNVDIRFKNVRCSVLPVDVSRDEIDDLEANLQARPQTKLEYDWIGEAYLIRRQFEKGRTIKQVADELRRSPSYIENALQALDEADLYLNEWIKKPREYARVLDGQQIFGDIPKSLQKKDTNLQNASRAIAWSIYENRNQISGRVYRFNQAFGKNAEKVLNELEAQLELDKTDVYDDNGDDFFIDIEENTNSKDYSQIIKTLREEKSKKENIEILINACETVIEEEKWEKNEQAALKSLGQVNSKLVGIDVSTAGDETLTSILNQIKTIRERLDKIEEDVKLRIENTKKT
ncbi:MAG: hypothetical protein OXD45_06035 [Rhodobacteraceae bacterium]|nr:hypothetical protein [Paracoccaceae bacterium]